MPELNRRLAEFTLGEVQQGFVDETDPSGRQWKPRKNIGDGHPLLNETGLLFDSFTAVIYKRGGFAVVNSVVYAQFHQHGTDRMPARRMLPSPTRIPRKYREGWQLIVDEMVHELG